MAAFPAVQQNSYTKEEYLAREESAAYKSEYYDGEIVAMAGGSYNHSRICCNIIRRLEEALDARDDCVGFESNMKLDIPAYNLFVYPDMMVACGDIEFAEGRTDIIKNPLLIIEVLSASTEQTDRMRKFVYYQSIPSVQEYALIRQDEPRVEVYFKQYEKSWIYTVAAGLDDAILFRSINHEFRLADIYRKVDWQQEEPR